MPTIRIRGGDETAALKFDLKEILAALGPSGLTAYWSAGDVAARGGAFDATGEGASELEGLAASGGRIVGSRLAQIAERIQQVIWGRFAGYEDKLGEVPRVVVIAFDSSWWEVQSDDEALLDRVAASFLGVERVCF